MKILIGLLILSLSLFLPLDAESRTQGVSDTRHFLFIGEPNAEAWKFMIENPQDREAAVSKPIKRLGGEVLGYYWGLGNGRNYIIVSMPDDPELIQATYVSRLGDGLLISYEMIELMTSADMAEALKRVSEVTAVDDLNSD